MEKRIERILVMLLDVLTINLAYLTFYILRAIVAGHGLPGEMDFISMVFLSVFWIVAFAISGLYRSWYAQSRVDEVITVARVASIGVLVLFFLFMLVRVEGFAISTALAFVAYWSCFLLFVGAGRFLFRTLQRNLLAKGIGTRNTVIVGLTGKALELREMVLRHPLLGYKLVGFVDADGKKTKSQIPSRALGSIPVLGKLDDLPDILHRYHVSEVLVGLDSHEHDKLLELLRFCNGREIGVKIMSDMYDIVSGQARVNSIYGVPLIDVRPEIMKPWEEVLKRTVDIIVSLMILLVGLPLWILIAAAIKITSKGPVFYRQQRVGKNGRVFKMLKFRSMVTDAERETGPQWARRNDPRVTRVGRILRRLHLDEAPQFINVLKGDMSLVGPRPERPYFVEKLSQQIPLYHRRHKVRPGITGWAQIKHTYDQSIDDVRTKLKYDFYYIENMSWRLDLKILLLTFLAMMRGKGHT